MEGVGFAARPAEAVANTLGTQGPSPHRSTAGDPRSARGRSHGRLPALHRGRPGAVENVG